jgi:hypothetical protein
MQVQRLKPAKPPQLESPSPSSPKDKGFAMVILQIKVRILTQLVRFSYPCKVEVQLTNRSINAVLINRRLAMGYRDSDARELFAEVFKRESDEVVSEEALLYNRDFSQTDDYVWLAAGQSVSTSFDLFEWYTLPGPGEYDLIVYYQADEPLAAKPANLLSGVYVSERIALSVTP